jgi:hypothetical protein
MLRRPAIAVIGGGDGASVEVLDLAHKVGAEIAGTARRWSAAGAAA